jgi:hypothetical protein
VASATSPRILSGSHAAKRLPLSSNVVFTQRVYERFVAKFGDGTS